MLASRILRILAVACGLSALTPQATQAATGDVYVYRISNGYNSEVRGKISYRIEKLQSDRVEVAVATDTPSAGMARTEVYATDGSWIIHPLASHDQLRDYEFLKPLPVYPPPGNPDDSWSLRVDARNPVTGTRASVRVDGEVLGTERLSVPAGAFDTIKIRRRIYAGDWDGFMRETQILEYDWYAPVLGRSVKIDSKSTWQDLSRCTRGGCPWFRGDWNVFELAEIDVPKR